MSHKDLETKISTLIAADLDAMGYELVRVTTTGGGTFMTLQVMAERKDDKPMTVSDCTQISHAVSAKLDTDETLNDRYTLEISSPGIDRPLVRVKDYERYQGHMAKVELEMPLDGAKGTRRFQGSITRVTQSTTQPEIEFHTDNGDLRVPMNTIARAKLILTDALLSAEAGTKH